MIDKTVLHQTMLTLEQSNLHCAEAGYREYLQRARVDNSDGYDDDEVSHAFESGDLAVLLDKSVHDMEEKLEQLKRLDFSSKNRVEPGAVIRFNNRYFVIGVATGQFDCNGESYMGISTDAPIYETIEFLKAGDEFEINGVTTSIQSIY